jgi:hypothetical protein
LFIKLSEIGYFIKVSQEFLSVFISLPFSFGTIHGFSVDPLYFKDEVTTRMNSDHPIRHHFLLLARNASPSGESLGEPAGFNDSLFKIIRLHKVMFLVTLHG